MNRCRRIAVYAAVLKTRSAFNPAAIANADILYISGVYYDHIITDRTHARCHRRRILHSHLPHPRNKFRPAAINGHGIGGLGRQPVIYDYFIAPGLIEHRNLYTVAKGRRAVCEDDVDILNEGSPTYRIVRYVIADILYETIIADRHIMQGRMIYSRMLADPPCKGKFLSEYTQPYLS